MQPSEFCKTVNLCQQMAIFSSQLREDSCGLCHQAVSEVLVKLKDPDTQVSDSFISLLRVNMACYYLAFCERLFQ